MTIREYLDKLPSAHLDFLEAMKDSTNIWSNAACTGYMIAALKAAGMDREQISRVIDNLTSIFDIMTVDEATQLYQDF